MNDLAEEVGQTRAFSNQCSGSVSFLELSHLSLTTKVNVIELALAVSKLFQRYGNSIGN